MLVKCAILECLDWKHCIFLIFVLHKVWIVMVEMVSFLFVRSVWETEVVSLVGGWV